MTRRPSEDQPWPPGETGMARLVREKNWVATPLGPLDAWPAPLRAAVELILPCGFPMIVLWGPDLVQVYNDGYRDLMGRKHPAGLGQPTRECWPEVWHINEPIYAQVRQGETVTREDAHYPLARRNGPEDSWLTLSYSPLRVEDGAVAGVLVTLVETTARVLAERQRAAAEAALRESEARHRLLVESWAQAVWETAADGEVVAESASWCRYTGQSPAEWLGDGWVTAIHPEDRAHALEGWRQGVAAQRLVDQEFRLRHAASGDWRWTNVRAVPLPGPDGQVVKWVGMNIDIDARRRAEAALRESEAQLRLLSDAMPAMMACHDREERYVLVNAEFERFFGVPRDRILGRAMREHVGERAYARLGPRVREALAGQEARFEDMEPDRQGSGRPGWTQEHFIPRRDARGSVQGFYTFALDITDRKRAEARLRSLLDGMPQLVWRSADGGQWTWSSRQWEEYTGQDNAHSGGFGWLDVVHPADRAGAEQAWRRAAANGLYQVDFRLRHAGSGRWHWFQTRGIPVWGEAGHGREWIGTCTDIDDQVLARDAEALEQRVAERTTELVSAQASLHQAQKMEAIGQLTGGIAHDFNNMLQAVVGGLEMARRQVDGGSTVRLERYLDAARDAAGRAATLTRRLLAFARQQRLAPRPLDADALIVGLADLIGRTVGPKVQLQLDLHDGHGSVLCDPSELESVLLNLCINARDAMPAGGRLVIGTRERSLEAGEITEAEVRPGRFLEIAVADTGTGMPPEVLARVFEPFFTTKPQGEGTGLGLSQVHGFIRQSQGLVQVESTPGQGTAVRLLLALHGTAGTAEAARELPALAPLAGARLRLLLVDDEDAARTPVADRLRDLGYEVQEARDARAALRRLAEAPPDLLVTDVGLPGGIDGAQLAELARRRLPELPVLFITGFARAPLPPNAEVVRKPFDLDVLARHAQSLLNGHAGRNSPAR